MARLVIAPRDLRMNLAGTIGIRVGCFGLDGDVCAATIEAHLAEPIRVSAAPGSRRTRLYRPFVLGRRGFTVRGGQGRVVRLQFGARGGRLARLAGTIPVRLVGRFNTVRARGLRAERVIDVYVSPLHVLR